MTNNLGFLVCFLIGLKFWKSAGSFNRNIMVRVGTPIYTIYVAESAAQKIQLAITEVGIADE